MPTYAYRCKSCGDEFDKTTHADAVKCEKDGCDGWARRIWAVNVSIQNLKREREGR